MSTKLNLSKHYRCLATIRNNYYKARTAANEPGFDCFTITMNKIVWQIALDLSKQCPSINFRLK